MKKSMHRSIEYVCSSLQKWHNLGSYILLLLTIPFNTFLSAYFIFIKSNTQPNRCSHVIRIRCGIETYILVKAYLSNRSPSLFKKLLLICTQAVIKQTNNEKNGQYFVTNISSEANKLNSANKFVKLL